MKPDIVNHPPHYTASRIEVIEYIEEKLNTLPLTPWQGMLWGNITKYMGRLGLKGDPREDAMKARWYLDRLIESYETET
jgi:hypothetical protein